MYFVGTIPTGLHVLHDCPGKDNPACVNPKHLWLGTARDNATDKVRKWHAKNVAFNRTKLLSTDVLKIRTLYQSGEFTYHALAEVFRISEYSIGEIIRRETWAWLYGPHPALEHGSVTDK